VQVTDDLLATFPNPATFSVANLSSPTLSVNPGFDGNGSNAVLAGTDTLAVGQTATITFDVTFDPMSLVSPLNDSSTVTASSPGMAGVSDISQDGNNPDPNGNSDPGDGGTEDQPTPIPFS
jgi:hypothetical protein